MVEMKGGVMGEGNGDEFIEIKGSVYENSMVPLDGYSYIECKFTRCSLIYKGGRPPNLENNYFNECEWVFDAEAGNTLYFMRELVKAGGALRIIVLDALMGE